MTTKNKLGLILFLFGLRFFPPPNNFISAVLVLVLIYVGAGLFFMDEQAEP